METEDRLCCYCGRTFAAASSAVRKGQAKYCSRKCYSSSRRQYPMVQRMCETCGAVFEVSGYQLEIGRGRFCSKKCRPWPAQSHATSLHYKTRKLFDAGLLTVCVCASCGEENVVAHHPESDRPDIVIWLCRPCHAKLHARHALTFSYNGKEGGRWVAVHEEPGGAIDLSRRPDSIPREYDHRPIRFQHVPKQVHGRPR